THIRYIVYKEKKSERSTWELALSNARFVFFLYLIYFLKVRFYLTEIKIRFAESLFYFRQTFSVYL
ncbi:MAG: hypothetical protein J6R06_03395, partial [Bacteroidales bacterium]|nr:hypothetical protein [Bacteroidales bacterium]